MRKSTNLSLLIVFIFAVLLGGFAHAQMDPCDFDCDADFDGSDLAELIAGAPGCDLAIFDEKFGTIYNQSDDFNQNNLDSKWTFVNPVGDGYVNITEAGGDAHLELNIPGGPSHDPWTNNLSVRVMQPACDTDFDVIVKFDSVPSQAYQMQGIIVEQDSSNWIRFGNYSNGNSLRLYAAVINGVDVHGKLNQVITLSGSSVYLRVQRTTNTWIYSYSDNGTFWTEAASFAEDLTVTQIGIYGGNFPEGSSPAYTVRADYFEKASDPITSEDGSVRPDTQAPFIHAPSFSSTPNGLIVRWYTDEPAFGAVEYGPDLSYGSTVTESGGPFYEHEVIIEGLSEFEAYHFRIRSEDSDSRVAYSGDYEVTFPVIDVWYGTTQTFGSLGQPQPYLNILGNVYDPEEVISISYTLNNGSPIALSIGEDWRRLENVGDFNVDLATAVLNEGANTVVITAQNADNMISEETVMVNYTANTVWPQPYDIDWSLLTADEDIQNVAQIVDGKWTLTGTGIRIVEPGYDRLVAVGDRTWINYEATVPVTVHATNDENWAAGLLFRWDGHTDTPVSCSQPKCGWEPLGDIGWLRQGTLEFWYGGQESRTWLLETEYMLKMRVETSGTDTTYSIKAWLATDDEPVNWGVTRTTSSTPASGSILLITHLADVTFGDVSIIALPDP